MSDVVNTPETPDNIETEAARLPEPSDDNAIVAADDSAERKKKRSKRWSELSETERKRRVVWIAAVVLALVAATVFTVFACIAADRNANTPRWATEALSTRAEVKARLPELFVPDTGLGGSERYYLVANERFDLRYGETPSAGNLAGYAVTFLATNRGNTDAGLFVFRLTGVRSGGGAPVLTEQDGDRIPIAYSPVEAREKIGMRSADGDTYAVYRLSAVVDGNLYVVTGERQSYDGSFGGTEREFAQSEAMRLIKLLIEQSVK